MPFTDVEFAFPVGLLLLADFYYVFMDYFLSPCADFLTLLTVCAVVSTVAIPEEPGCRVPLRWSLS